MYTVVGYDKDNNVYVEYAEYSSEMLANVVASELDRLVKEDKLRREDNGEPIDWIEVYENFNEPDEKRLHVFGDFINYTEHEFWNKNKLWDLRQEICFGSLFLSDYENSFGIPKEICFGFFDGFIEDCFLIEEEKENGLKEFYDIFDKYDNADALWDYFYGIEYPFGELEEDCV